MKVLILTINVILVCKITYQENSPPTVTLPLGKLTGFVDHSIGRRTFYSFEGVPYAKPPVGEYRFREPTIVEPWIGTVVANTKYTCMQYYQYTEPGQDFVIGDEDCLYLNIYTPSLSANLDVIVYIHGGAFMFNSGHIQQPHYLLDKNVVYVSINYRLGPLGFLSTENDIVPGNNGIKDQNLALQWINKYIEYFGGNPRSITLIGMSAGGASVHLHYLTPKSKGLFHKGISQSGTALNSWVLMEKPLETSKEIATSVGCSTDQIQEMVNCLRKRSGREIVHAVKNLQPWLYNPFSPFGVVVDTWSSDPILPDHPYNLLKQGAVADLPWIASYTNSEGLYPAADFYSDQHLQEIDSQWNQLVPFILHYHYTVESSLQDSVSQKIRRFYLKDQNVSKSNFMNFVDIISDRLFVYDIEKGARLQASSTKSPVYVYQFTYRGAHSKSERRSGVSTDFGAAHGDDTSYIFRTNVNTTSTDNDRLMLQLFVEMVASFAKNSVPNVPASWTPLSSGQNIPFSYLRISSPSDLRMESEESVGNRQFWESLPIKENERLCSLKDEL